MSTIANTISVNHSMIKTPTHDPELIYKFYKGSSIAPCRFLDKLENT
jgi:hypothetical protein